MATRTLKLAQWPFKPIAEVVELCRDCGKPEHYIVHRAEARRRYHRFRTYVQLALD